ncbi:MAG: hypothetical protein K2I81_02325, partial [Alphaproteobacteria bacterium]|nr:hypothetical protein [Alphaproteobacteria bacterium]
SGRPFYIKNSDFNMYGISADFAFGCSDDFWVGGAMYGAMAESDDEINAFLSQMFGSRIFAGLGGDVVNMRGTVGLTYADFDVPYVFDKGRVLNNLHAVSTYAAADMGFPVGIVAPFVGAEYHAAYMLGKRDVSSALRVGIDAGFTWSGETVGYECMTTVAANTDAEQTTGVKVGFFSPDDMIGGDVSIHVIHAGNGLSGMFSFSAKVRF